MGLTVVRNSVSAVVVALLMAAGAVMIGAPAHANEADDQFIEQLDLEGVPYANRTEVILVAKEYCLARTRQSVSMGRVNNNVSDAMKWSGTELQDFARAAVRAYCS